MRRTRTALIWAALAAGMAVPVVVAATSPLLAWRDAVYIIAGFAGIIALALMLLQPLLAGGYVPGLPVRLARRIHQAIGVILVIAIVVHVGGLWITSPPDVMDALTFAAPTAFSAWGVTAMWALFIAALLALLRRRLRLRPRTWRIGHTSVALVVVVGSIVHAVLIIGAMETVTKVALCLLVLAATVKVVADVWLRLRRTR